MGKGPSAVLAHRPSLIFASAAGVCRLMAHTHVIVTPSNHFDLGDNKTNETTRLKALTPGNWSRLTAPIYDLLLYYTVEQIIAAKSPTAIFSILRDKRVGDLAEFRSNHVSLWMAAGLGLCVEGQPHTSLSLSLYIYICTHINADSYHNF